MLSKFFRVIPRVWPMSSGSFAARPQISGLHWKSSLMPPTQYDQTFPNRLKLGYAARNHWETAPTIVCTGFVFVLLIGVFYRAYFHKVDITFRKNHATSISRTMDLRNPTVHKLFVINQKYEPWPEMQDVLDKMKEAEMKLREEMTYCDEE